MNLILPRVRVRLAVIRKAERERLTTLVRYIQVFMVINQEIDQKLSILSNSSSDDVARLQMSG